VEAVQSRGPTVTPTHVFLQRVTACCSVLQCEAPYSHAVRLQRLHTCVAVYCSVLQFVAARCCVAAILSCSPTPTSTNVCCSALQCVAVCGS